MTQEQLDFIINDPKTFLLRSGKLKARITAKRERIKEWQSLAEQITAPLRVDGGSSGSGYAQSTIENAVCNITDLENEILEEIKTLISIEQEIDAAINELVVDTRYKSILEMKYLNGYSWRKIGFKLYYSEDWVCRLHGAALQAMKKKAKSVRV